MKNTFGKTPAAFRLAELVENNASARRKVASLLSKYTAQMFEVVHLENPDTARLCFNLLRNHALDVRSYAKNLVNARYRQFRKDYDYVISVRDKQQKKS
jgi:hypothetical protein